MLWCSGEEKKASLSRKFVSFGIVSKSCRVCSSYAHFLPPIIDLTNQRHRINCDVAGHRFLAVSTTFLEGWTRFNSSVTPPPTPPLSNQRRVPFRARRFVHVPANKLINEQTSGDINERQELIISPARIWMFRKASKDEYRVYPSSSVSSFCFYFWSQDLTCDVYYTFALVHSLVYIGNTCCNYLVFYAVRKKISGIDKRILRPLRTW